MYPNRKGPLPIGFGFWYSPGCFTPTLSGIFSQMCFGRTKSHVSTVKMKGAKGSLRWIRKFMPFTSTLSITDMAFRKKGNSHFFR